MLRQCAWCLRLIDSRGECLSAFPVAKLYDATHGMCGVCGALWMEQVLNSLSLPDTAYQAGYSERVEGVPQDTLITSIQEEETAAPPMMVRERGHPF